MLRDELASTDKTAFRWSSELVLHRDFRTKTSISPNEASCQNNCLFHLARNEIDFCSCWSESARVDGGWSWLLPPMHASAPDIPPTNQKSGEGFQWRRSALNCEWNRPICGESFWQRECNFEALSTAYLWHFDQRRVPVGGALEVRVTKFLPALFILTAQNRVFAGGKVAISSTCFADWARTQCVG